MKKTISLILSILLVLSFTLNVSADNEVFNVDENGTITAYFGEYSDVLKIPSDVDGKKITALFDGLFCQTPIKTIYIDDGVEKIGDHCFAESSLDYIDIPASVTTIGDNAFKNCQQLTSLAIGSDKTEFGKDAFADTGFLYIAVPCTLDLITLYDKIADAKGDENFYFDIMHTGLVESMVEKDAFGHNMLVCNDCGFKGSMYFDDVKMPFEDVQNDTWYYNYVATAYEFGILNGKSETEFDPNANMTLAEAAKIAACIHYYFYAYEDYDFTTETRDWYEPYVDYCYENGIIDYGISFDWNKNATRAEMAYFFSNADRGDCIVNPDVPLTDIPDVDISTPYAINILELYRRGIATGSDEYMTFYPDANVLRSEAAAFISRIICYDMRVNLPKG